MGRLIRRLAMSCSLSLTACAAGGSNVGSGGQAATGTTSSASSATSSSTSSGTGGAGTGGAGTGGAGTGGAGTGGGTGGDMTCGLTDPAPAATTAEYTVSVHDFLAGTPVDGLTVKACAGSDPMCAAPLGTGTTVAGTVILALPTPLPSGFEGYFDISSPGAAIIPMLSYLSNPVAAPGSVEDFSLPPSDLTLLASLAGTTVDPSRGSAAMIISDCADSPTAGLTLKVSTADGHSTIGYMASGVPSKTATSTDSTGLAYALNLPPGKTTLTTFDPASHLRLGQLDVWIRAGAMTEIAFVPTP